MGGRGGVLWRIRSPRPRHILRHQRRSGPETPATRRGNPGTIEEELLKIIWLFQGGRKVLLVITLLNLHYKENNRTVMLNHKWMYSRAKFSLSTLKKRNVRHFYSVWWISWCFFMQNRFVVENTIELLNLMDLVEFIFTPKTARVCRSRKLRPHKG